MKLVFILAFITLCFAQKNVDQLIRAGGCSTAVVNGLSKQLIDELQCIVPGTFKSIDNIPLIQRGAAAFPFLQAPAVDALVRAVNSQKRTMVINSALRTLPQQYMLFKWHALGLCGIQAAAFPGRSNHNGALAVDVQDSATWITPMQKQGWKWFGPNDVPHFDFTGAGAKDIRANSILAFQRLWNRNNPNDKITEDGLFGPGTETRLQRSPGTGFPTGATCGAIGGTGSDPVSPIPCTASGFAGVCINTADCTGTSTAGLCPGAANIQCCTKSTIQALTTCTLLNGVSGICQDASTCTGVSTPGFCPGASNIQCCTPGTPATLQTISDAGLDLIKSFEGFEPTAQPDPIGIPTIGFGHNCEALGCAVLKGKDSNGNFVTLSVPLSREEGTQLLRADLGPFEACVRGKLTRTVNSNEFSALVSFVFNVGCTPFGASTLLTRVNANAPLEGTNGIRNAFLRFNKAGGVVLSGLTRRRNAEADLYGGSTRSVPAGGNPDTGIGGDCFSQGEKGVCLDAANCTGNAVRGLCPGASSVQCCLRNKCTVNTKNDGICTSTKFCTGTSVPGKCFGASDVQCCVGTVSRVTAIQCPPGSAFDFTAGFCADASSVYGPFPTGLSDACTTTSGGVGCSDKQTVTVGQQVASIPRMQKSIFNQIRGTGICPVGTVADSGSLGWCVESRTQADGSSYDYIYGGFEVEAGQACQESGGGASCYTARWSNSFWKSVGTGKSGLPVVENSFVSPANDDESVEVSNPYLDSQLKLNDGIVIAEANVGTASVVLNGFLVMLLSCLVVLVI